MPGRFMFFLFVFLFVHNFVIAQNNQTFTRLDNVFIEELKELFEDLDRTERQEMEEFVDSFAVVWMHGNLMSTQKIMVYETLDAMNSMRLRKARDYPLYLEGILAVLNTYNSNSNFEQWHKSFDGLLDLRNQRRFLNHLQYSINLFKDNEVYSTSTMLWKYDKDDFSLNYENDTLKVLFSGGNLILYAQRDSLLIKNTDGVVFPFDEKWKGSGGRITWERVDLDPERVYANLSDYEVNLKVTWIEADSVEFFNYDFFDTPLHGKLRERIIADSKPESARFPSFQSYQVVHEIRDIFEDISYIGGFTMQGQRVLGSGTEEAKAQVLLYNNDSLFISARANAFIIRSDRISADRASVSVYYSGDSIYHPAIQMRYIDSSGEFYMLRDEKGISRAPFRNTYHSIDMYCEALYWHKDENELTLQSIRGFSGEGKAVFQSHDFFDDLLYMRLQGIADINPIFLLRNYARDHNTNTFRLDDYARFIRANLQSTKALLITMSYQGFLIYDHDNDLITITDKVHHYIGAVLGRSDFDVMNIESHARVNARINLLNFDLHIEGISRIPLSSSKNVVLHPFGNRIIMQKNRNIYFNGRIESGLFDFFGKEFFFDYDEFKIDLVNTDSLSFRVRSFEPDSRGMYSYVRVKTVLEGINGELLIDNPNNKSGRLPIPRYPIFNSDNESYVYYDREYVQSGTYKRADVYFRLIPFTVDSLDHATTENIAFDGVFISTGIFPDFTDYLTVQEDYSLGFNTETPEEGYPVFNGKAHYYGPIDMSYEGLMANGKMEYLNSTIEAEKMIMFPDSARAEVNTFTIAEQLEPVEYPNVTARDVDMLFLPWEDQLTISETEEPIELYAGLSTLRGDLSISPEGVTGSGNVGLFGSEISADFLAFNAKSFDSPNADFKIFTSDGQNVAFNAFNYSGHFDMDVFSGVLDGLDTQAKISFPENRFDGYGYNFDWDMSGQTISLNNQAAPTPDEMANLSLSEIIDLDFSGYELVSTHRAQDSLSFFAGKIDFAVEDNIINASEVNIIKVADAAVFPDKGEVSILPRAEIRRLDNAIIIANTTTRFHKFYDVTAEILTKNRYRATGKYDYIDELSESQQIYFDDIDVVRGENTTIAKGRVFEDQSFSLSPNFDFKGEMVIQAAEEHLTYKGSARIVADCEPMNINWFRFETVIDPNNIVIPVDEDLRNDDNVEILTALVLAGDSFHIYPAFFDRQKHHMDKEIISANGYLEWNPISREYQLSTDKRLKNSSEPDNFIRFNPNTCMLVSEGVVDIGSDLGQFETKAYGTVSHNIAEFKTEYDIVLGLDFFFVNSGMAYIADNLSENESLQTINLNRQKYLKALRKEVGEVQSLLVREEFIETGGLRRVPAAFTHTMFFADIKLRWDQGTNSLVSFDRLGVGGINRTPLNKYVNGHLQIRKLRGGDVLSFILDPTSWDDYLALNEDDPDSEPDEYEDEEVSENDADEQELRLPSKPADSLLSPEFFFFTYANSILQVIAANSDFNEIIRELKPRRRRMDVPSGQPPFAFILASERRAHDFARAMHRMKD